MTLSLKVWKLSIIAVEKSKLFKKYYRFDCFVSAANGVFSKRPIAPKVNELDDK
jgi:hypothetical protein